MEEFFLEYKLTIICSSLIIIWFIPASKKFEKYVSENPFGEYEQPRTAATLGVIGTFLGITLGLWDFDSSPEAMQESVTTLLGGMRSAFFTSILGMGLSIYFKNMQANAQKNFQSTSKKYEATITDLINYLKADSERKSENERKLSAAMEKLTASLAKIDKTDSDEKILAALEKLKTSLVGDGDYTVIGQMKTLRLEMRANNDKIIFAIQDFYKSTIDKTNEYAKIISDIASDSVSEFENFSNQAIKSMQEVSKRIESTSYKQREIMDSEVKSAKDYVQKIIANLGNGNARVTKTISDSLNNMMKTNNENLQKSTENLNKNLEKVLKESLEKFGDTMYKVSAKFVNDYTPLTQKLANLINIAKDAERRAYR